MSQGAFSLQDQLARLLSNTTRGVSVERLRTLLHAGGATVRKDEIVRALNDLSQRGVVQFDSHRRWKLRRTEDWGATNHGGQGGAGDAEGRIHAVPANVLPGQLVETDPVLPEGALSPDLHLLTRLLPYYQACLRASDGGAPIESLKKAGESFVLLHPNLPWWPSDGWSKRIRIPRERLPGPFHEALARASGGKLVLGYPNLLITPRDPESDPFLRPVASYRCSFNFDEMGLTFEVPAVSPALNPAWLKDQRRYSDWDPNRLRSWLLFEDEDLDLADEDEAIPPGFLEAPAFCTRLESALNRFVRGTLDPGALQQWIPREPGNGLYNVVSLSCEGSGKYTRSAIKDYERLLTLPEGQFGETALAPLFGLQAPDSTAVPVLNPLPMGESQLVAARSALNGPVTVITGPPGTGKSQVIAALIISAVAANKSVLFAARQHRALDAVEERLNNLTGERALMVRANDSEGANSFSFQKALRALIARADNEGSPHQLNERLRKITDLDRARWRALDAHRAVAVAANAAARSRLAMEDAEDRLRRECETAEQKGISVEHKRPPSLVRAIGRWIMELLHALGVFQTPTIGTRRAFLLAEELVRKSREALADAESTLRRREAERKAAQDDPVSISEEIQGFAEQLIPHLLNRLENLSLEERQRLTSLRGEAALQAAVDFPKDALQIVLAHMPVWAVTTLGAGSRVPLEPALFDYVIFDEAAQTDIASALPLMYRAKSAVIVGDPHQLTMISNLDPREERALLDQHGLYKLGIGLYAQGQTSLFDLAASSAAARRFMLTDHFRCHPEIVGYINEAFYGRRLAALTDVARLMIPRGMQPGLHWTDVSGPVIRRSSSGGVSSSAASLAEADAIVTEVRRLAETGFEGTIGVVSFFDYQAREISSRLNSEISREAIDRHRIKVFTANKFQGDERDVILLSLCMAPDMPPGALNFIRQEKRLLNVAVSRARAVCHVFGDMRFAERCGVPHVETLVRRVKFARQRDADGHNGDDRFDSVWEHRFYDALVTANLSPIPQYPVGGRFLDLAFIDEDREPPIKIDVEVDGVAYHRDSDGDRVSSDLWRDHQLRGLGWRILRFWVYELRDDMEGCVERVKREITGS